MEQHHGLTAYDYDRCGRIWRRVSPELAPYPGYGAKDGPSGGRARDLPAAAPDTPEALRGLLHEKQRSARRCRAAARCAPDRSARQALLGIADAERSHARSLQAAYYLATGQTCPAAAREPRVPTGNLCAALRALCHAETESARRYEDAAARTADSALHRLYTQIAAEDARHAERLRALLIRALGV